MIFYKNKILSPFKIGTILAVYFSLLFILLWSVRFFKVDIILNLLPETIREMFDESPKWVFYGYLCIALTNLVASILLFKKKIAAVTISQLAGTGMLILITYHFFSNNDIGLYEAVEMLFTLIFYLMLAWFSKYATEKGYLSKFAKETTKVSLKVQEGCDHKCEYCLIPIVRGASKSDSLENILLNAKKMAAEGIKDIVLIGDNIGDFGKGEKGNLNHLHSFFDLLKELDKIGDIHRFSFMSVTTPMISDKTLLFIKESNRFSPYFSIKMDSGSQTTLELMNRPFPLNAYKELYLNIKRILPDAYIIVEVIVGFPGETDQLFNETVQFLSQADISYISVAIYNDKRGTKAANIKESVVSKKIRYKRKKVLTELSKNKLQTFYQSQIGKEEVVLFENKRRGDYIYGYTGNHIKIKAAWNPILANTLCKVKLTGIHKGFMLFNFVDKKEFSEEYVKI